MPEPVKRHEPLPGIGALAFAWSGGLVFVVSLVLFLYLYDFGYREAPAPAAAAGPALFDVGLFSLFALHHSLFARTGLKRMVCRLLPSWLERSSYTWVASLLFIVVCAAWQPLPGTVYTLTGTWRAAAYVVQLGAILLTARASAAIDVLDLAGIRPVLDAGRRATRHVPLETSGVYRLVRHPLYFGWVIFVFVPPVMTFTRLLFAVVSTGYLVVAIPFEERSLVDVFGDEYRAYQRKTRWRMVPGLW